MFLNNIHLIFTGRRLITPAYLRGRHSNQEAHINMRPISFSKILIAVLVFAVAGFFSTAHSQEKANVVIKGSTTVLPITLKAIEAYKKIAPGVGISVDGSGSGNGIKALLDGSCDIANSSRAMKKEEFTKAAASKGKIKEIIVAYDMIVPIVHPTNKVKNLTKEQLKGIYDGSIKDWSEIGGDKGKIVVISRDTSSGTYEYWHEDVMKKSEVRKDALLQASSGAVVSAVANNRRALAYVGFGYLNNRVHACQVNGVDPTLENGKSGKFPISRPLYNYVNEKNLSKEAKAFIDFIIGKDGQKLVKDAGFIPLN